MRPTKVLIVEDEEGLCGVFRHELRNEVPSLVTVGSLPSRIQGRTLNSVDLVVVDIRRITLSELRRLAVMSKTIRVVVFQGLDSVRKFPIGEEWGEIRFARRPPKVRDLVEAVRGEIARLFPGQRTPRPAKTPTAPVIATSPAMAGALFELCRLADSWVPILLEGEIGTGKRHLARHIHDLSCASGRRLSVVECFDNDDEWMVLRDVATFDTL
jgi:DNA-binding NtrC family response regulator